MTKQDAINIAQAKINRCSSFLNFVEKQKQNNSFVKTHQMTSDFYDIVESLVSDELETLTKIVDAITKKNDSQRKEKPL
ncbi:MAG: hypothetical protein EPO37_01750 [Nitrosarchaeum sp.]|nr:MAG: hypothetical protein EPO37_01750 [Nitrosarchaeum sp.]